METDEAARPPFGGERRRHPRFLVRLPAEYRRANDSILRPGHTVNLSEEGLMVSVSEQMDIGEKLEMKIYFSFLSRLITIGANVKIEWKDSAPGDDGYRVGVSFANISPVDMEKLKGFLNLYGDLNQVPPELKSPRGSLPIPSKPSATKPPRRAPVPKPSIPALLKRLLATGKRAIGKFVRIYLFILLSIQI